MFNQEEYWARRKAGQRGQLPVPAGVLMPGSGKAQLIKFQGEEVYIPRVERRKVMRKFRTDVLKGRIDVNKMMKERLESDRAE